MCHLLLSDVQATNLRMLYAIRLGTEHDMVETCRKFSLNVEQAERLRSITPEGLWTLVHAVGQTSLFIPRSDLIQLIDAPSALAGTLAAVHPPSLSTPKQA
ncbi:hypothetical protein [Burkholderia vietnamiensis]|uniref:hypothetical protein n=1 Tax=Burkholderia vietnamiensis TaxID=60552 RepID=UPI001D13EDAF|nr:hypothetical protein [Burkholderia vietnamiensis]UEC01759.1 hypothetical protein LK462_06955 [Burkholderia vietnamiensis]